MSNIPIRVGADRALSQYVSNTEIPNGIEFVPGPDSFDFSRYQLDLSGIDLAHFAEIHVVPMLPVPQPVLSVMPELPQVHPQMASAHSRRNQPGRGPYKRSGARCVPFNALWIKLGFPNLRALNFALTQYGSIREAECALTKTSFLTDHESLLLQKEFTRCRERMRDHGSPY